MYWKIHKFLSAESLAAKRAGKFLISSMKLDMEVIFVVFHWIGQYYAWTSRDSRSSPPRRLLSLKTPAKALPAKCPMTSLVAGNLGGINQDI